MGKIPNYETNNQDHEVLILRSKGTKKNYTNTNFNTVKREVHKGSGLVKTDKNVKKLDEETENLKIDKIDSNISREIVNARTKSKLSQKDLAKQCSISLDILKKYENGTAQRDMSIIKKLERKLRVKLIGKGITK